MNTIITINSVYPSVLWLESLLINTTGDNVRRLCL